MASRLASTSIGLPQALITASGSLSRCPVVIHTTVSSFSITSSLASFLKPAIDAALAGSTPILSFAARSL